MHIKTSDKQFGAPNILHRKYLGDLARQIFLLAVNVMAVRVQLQYNLECNILCSNLYCNHTLTALTLATSKKIWRAKSPRFFQCKRFGALNLFACGKC